MLGPLFKINQQKMLLCGHKSVKVHVITCSSSNYSPRKFHYQQLPLALLPFCPLHVYLWRREVQKEVFLLWTIINYQRKRFIMTFTRTIIVRSSSFELMRNENMSPVACGCCRPVCRTKFPLSLSPNLCWTQPMEPSSLIIKHFLFNLN